MNAQPKVLLLIGSAKQQGRSTSESLGGYLCDRLDEYGWGTQTLYVHRALRSEARTRAMLDAVDAPDLVVLATPLYVDSLPYLTTVALERIAAHRVAEDASSSTRFVAIVNCGFSEAAHNDVALAICRQFAHAAKLEWAGGLSMGGGGVVHGVPLTEHGGRATGIRRALDLATEALVAGQSVPDEAAELLAKPVIPHRLYTTMGNLGWYRTAWKLGTYRHLRDRPFARQHTGGGLQTP